MNLISSQGNTKDVILSIPRVVNSINQLEKTKRSCQAHGKRSIRRKFLS